MTLKDQYNKLTPGKQRLLRNAFYNWFGKHRRCFYNTIKKSIDDLKPYELDFFNKHLTLQPCQQPQQPQQSA